MKRLLAVAVASLLVAAPPDIVLYTNHIDIAPLLRAAPELRPAPTHRSDRQRERPPDLNDAAISLSPQRGEGRGEG